MTAGEPKPADELRMSAQEFDRIMGEALQVRPERSLKAKSRAKPKTKRAKTRPAK
jgi:hypothetical protein